MRITDSDLVNFLETSLSNFSASDCHVFSLTRQPCVKRSSFALEQLDVSLNHGSNLQVIFKQQGSKSLLDQAPSTRLDSPYDPHCEMNTYLSVLCGRFGTAHCYGASERSGQVLLLLEHVKGIELADIGEISRWKQVAKWLAEFHESFGKDPKHRDKFLDYGPEFYNLWRLRATDALSRYLPEVLESKSQPFSEFLSNYDYLVERLLELPKSLIHGEFYPSNVILSFQSDSTTRICPVDWATTAFGPGLIDLAALTTGDWGDTEEREIAETYRQASLSNLMEKEEFFISLTCCKIHLIMQWLSFSAGNLLFSEKALEWLEEALRLHATIRDRLK